MSSTEIEIAAVVDATGLRCPLPMLRAKKALLAISIGQKLLVRSTDPDSVKDFQTYTELKGHRLLSFGCVEGVFEFTIEK